MNNPKIMCGGKEIEHKPVLTGRATLAARVIRKDGTVEDKGIVSINKVTTAFVIALCYAMVNATYINTYKYHGSGIGTTAEANTQTALVSEIAHARAVGTQVCGANTYQSVATITYDGTYAVTEHAVFSASSSGTMLDRSLFTAINVNNLDSIQFTYILTINPEA